MSGSDDDGQTKFNKLTRISHFTYFFIIL